jgi:hypothetical protein
MIELKRGPKRKIEDRAANGFERIGERREALAAESL